MLSERIPQSLFEERKPCCSVRPAVGEGTENYEELLRWQSLKYRELTRGAGVDGDTVGRLGGHSHVTKRWS